MPLPRSARSSEPASAGERSRLDQAMVARGIAATRARARDLIVRGLVTVDGVVATKPGHAVSTESAIALVRAMPQYVSRGAEKLAAGLAAFGFDCAGRSALDVGASTGGFTEVLLQGGARRVFAVDVGRDQLHATLRCDPRVISLEATDARTLTTAHVGEPVDAVVSDVSFISLTKALPAALALARSGAWLIALIKPQFEAGAEYVGKGGIVRDAAVHARVVEDIRGWLEADMGWRIEGVIPSPISGGDGNREFLIGATKP